MPKFGTLQTECNIQTTKTETTKEFVCQAKNPERGNTIETQTGTEKIDFET